MTDASPETKSKAGIFGTRIVEAIIIAALTAAATSMVSLKVVEARIDHEGRIITEVRAELKEATRELSKLNSHLGRMEALQDERAKGIDARLRALEMRGHGHGHGNGRP